MRDMLFVSHANPEDNEFARWIALQLAKEGYPVWCDLTELLGGENFWKDIDDALRQRTVKFLYVLSKVSNVKVGPLRELDLALTLMRRSNIRDFVIPLLIDDLSHDDMYILLRGINTIQFHKQWAKGLKVLLDKLEKDQIQKSDNFNPGAVADWWRTQFSADSGVLAEPEDYVSNWFPIDELPSAIYFHVLQDSNIGELRIPHNLPYPGFLHNRYLVSFAPASDFANCLGSVSIIESEAFITQGLLDGNVPDRYVKRDRRRDLVYRLLRMGWETFANARKLETYNLAQDANCFCFIKGVVENDTIYFKGVNDATNHRAMIGYSTVKGYGGRPDSKRIWHFAVEAKPLVYPITAYILKPHLVFSDDGSTIWTSKLKSHRARRSQGRNWWNPQWRDRILATMSWLADGQEFITIPLGTGVEIKVLIEPMSFRSPVSYLEPNQNLAEIETLQEDGVAEEIEEDEDEEESEEGIE